MEILFFSVTCLLIYHTILLEISLCIGVIDYLKYQTAKSVIAGFFFLFETTLIQAPSVSSLRSMAVLSSKAHERRSREIRARKER